MKEMEYKFKIESKFKPAGSQPEAIDSLVSSIKKGVRMQTLMGVTGSGKTFTMANVIEKVNKPTLVIAHNKTLAAQLYKELKELFPNNRVEYFISFYDYYQPESYLPSKDQYIEKDSQINPLIERMRLSATASLMQRKDTIIVSSVSCIYSLGDPKNFLGLGFDFSKGEKVSRNNIMSKMLDIQYERNDIELLSGRFRVKGDTIDIIPGYEKDIFRIEFFGDEIEKISVIDRHTGNKLQELDHYFLFPARHFVTPQESIERVLKDIEKDMEKQLPKLGMIQAHRLKQRTLYDIDMLKSIGFCKGIENYSRYFDGRKEGDKPYCLLDYFGDDFLIVIDESHQTIPQIHAMYNGDRQRKQVLIDYGFRLPSALDNRPLKFEEFENYMKKNYTVFVSATPAKYEEEFSQNTVEQVIRPTGLVDPVVEIRPEKNHMQDLIKEIKANTKRGDRTLVIALTKKLAEEISDFLSSNGINTRYLHSEVNTLERTEIIRQLRAGRFDVLVGINLLREGIDIPELGLVAILDADKEGFLRNQSSLIQIIGRAARNINSKVILYADRMTDSIKLALEETARRRNIQLEYNKKNKIKPKTIKKPVEQASIVVKDTKHIPTKEKEKYIMQLEKEMRQAADEMNFELAIALRDQLKSLQEELGKKNKTEDLI
ncbi:MAG TPA: excinuclease ABC subunit UvrB [Candidatus Nanoarchaeia archaeon]|nr:excinuclease ABC subunit UvrB [Candidatus Nanoarchaeia archaeon]